MTTESADGVALVLSESMPSLEGEARTLALTLVRLLTEGEPVTMAAFAEAAGVERGSVEELVDGVPGLLRDDRGRVIGVLGLSLTETPHRREVGDAHAGCVVRVGRALPAEVDRPDRAGAIAVPARARRSRSPFRRTQTPTRSPSRVPAERRPRGDDGVSRSMTRAGPR